MNELAIKLHEAAMVLENDGDFYSKYTRLNDCQASTRRDTIQLALRRNSIDQAAMTRTSGLGGTDLREHLRRYLDDVWDMLPPADVATCAAAKRWKELKFWEDSVKYPPVPAPQAEAPPAGNGKPLPDDVELQTIGGQEWHVTRVPDVRTIATEVDNLTTNNIWKDHAQDSLAYINNLLETQAKETIMNNATNTAAITITTKTLVNGVDTANMTDSTLYDLIAKQEAAVADLEKIVNKPKKLVNEIAKRKAGIQALVDYLDSKEPADKADSAPAAE